jgi:hypothetical protein
MLTVLIGTHLLGNVLDKAAVLLITYFINSKVRFTKEADPRWMYCQRLTRIDSADISDAT